MKKNRSVFIDSEDLYQGKTAKIIYNGQLAKGDTNGIYLHLGFGLMWDNLTEIKMQKTKEGYVAEIPIVKADTLNFCFRDAKNNWDNNSCKNYSYEVSKPKEIQATAKTFIKPATKIASSKVEEISTRIEKSTPLIPNELSLVPSKTITEAYIQRKKNKLMFYRLFNFIPRDVTGAAKKNKGLFSGLWNR